MQALFDEVQSDTLRELFEFLVSDEICEELQSFLEENCAEFRGNDEDFEEQTLERFDIYKRYCALLDKHLSLFCKERGFDAHDIIREAEETCLPQSMESMLLDLLLASASYEAFMVNMNNFKRFEVTTRACEAERTASNTKESKFSDDHDIHDDVTEAKCDEFKSHK
mmetsp:Transcript_2234/g.4244  ORF Transcript_2234/g.4244 Transcript_2234/m.4244 type:complete len:167 (+) Transcript_2234:757-1257(+)